MPVEAVFAGKAITPKITVAYGSKKLTQDTHYTVSYKSNTNVGTATIEISGKESGGYTGSVSKTFSIVPKEVTPTVTLSQKAFVYDGSVKQPSLSVEVNSTKITTSADKPAYYTATYAKGCKKAGVYTIKVSLKGNFSGSQTVSFVIKPKATALSTVSAGTAAFTAEWDSQKEQTSGYELQYSLDRSFGTAETIQIQDPSAVRQEVPELESEKTYFVRIRCFKNTDQTTCYSDWSDIAAVRTN